MSYFNKHKNAIIGGTIGLTIGALMIFATKKVIASQNTYVNFNGEAKSLPVGFPLGVRNNNPGNIRKNANNDWQGRIPLDENTDPNFEQFRKYTDGVRALIILLYGYFQDGLDSIKEIIEVYAPSHENDTDAYIEDVSDLTGWGKYKTIEWNATNIKKLVFAIIKHENGGYYLKHSQFQIAWEGFLKFEREHNS